MTRDSPTRRNQKEVISSPFLIDTTDKDSFISSIKKKLPCLKNVNNLTDWNNKFKTSDDGYFIINNIDYIVKEMGLNNFSIDSFIRSINHGKKGVLIFPAENKVKNKILSNILVRLNKELREKIHYHYDKEKEDHPKEGDILNISYEKKPIVQLPPTDKMINSGRLSRLREKFAYLKLYYQRYKKTIGKILIVAAGGVIGGILLIYYAHYLGPG